MMVSLWTIGHSNHTRDVFLGLLDGYEISVLVDVRSRPRSRWAQFNQKALTLSLEECGRAYLWLPELGGMPAEDELQLPNGDADFEAIRASDEYASALDEVIAQASAGNVALMCSEGNPKDCHRFSTLTPDLATRGVDVQHILRDGSLLVQLI